MQLQALGKSGEDSTEIIREFGNALALSGTAPRELNQVVNAIRQMAGEGKILQEDIAILTTRVAALVPHLKEAFGGTRAKDVREFFDALGVDESQQADRFLRIVLDRLKELPRAGETASNAIENLGDTTQRLQAAIGASFLPLVKEATGALEGLLQGIEREPQLARTIAILEALGGTFLTVTAAGVGLAAALPALIAAIASLGAPILVPIAIVGGLTAALVALKVASQDIETQVEQLAATFDELDEALRSNHEAIQSNQQAQVESAKSSLTIQRDAIQQHITLLEEERASIERSIEANRKRAEQGLLPIASTGESFATQLDNANARLEVTQHRLQEVNDALRANEKAAVPIQKATVNIDTLTKAVTRLKAELEEETTFEGISQSVTGDPAGFRSSAQALADIETLLRVNVDRFKELREAAASGNQEAATALSKLNQQFEGLRDTQADRHVDNLSAAFDELNQSTNVTSSQLADVLQATQAFVNVFQGTGGLIQDDVARAAELIDDIQARLNSVRREEQLPKTERQRRKSQADEEPESQIEQITEQRQKELQAQVEVARELFQIRKDIREAENQAEIDAAEEQAAALLRVNGRFVSQFIELRGLITDEAIAQAERLRDQSLARLSNEVEERQALYEDDLKAQRQVEQAKRQENENTYDFDAYLAGLRTKNRQEAAQDLIRLEERALDASSQRQRENLIRETQQFVDAYAQRGEAFRDLVADAQELGGELQEAFDLTEQQKRLEDFQDSVAGVLDNLAGIAIDHIFDSFSDSAQRATDAVGTFVDEVRGELQLLQNDITRLTRFDEDQGVRRQRLIEDRDRRLAQLQRERQTLAARSPTGDQGAIERNVQRQQDLTARITRLREDFGVRLSRFDEDTDRRRSRTIEDATQRRENFEARGTDESLISKLVGSLTGSLSNTLSSTLSSALAGALTGALQSPFQSLLEGIKGLFGGGDSTQAATTTTPSTDTSTGDPSGQIALTKEDITPPAEAIALKGVVSLMLSDITTPTEAVDLKGRIGTIEELSESVKLPPVPGLKGGIIDIVLQQNASKPIVPGLVGEIAQLLLAENLDIPDLPALRIPVIYDIPDLPEGQVDVGPLEVIGPPTEPTDETPASAPSTTAPTDPIDLHGMITLALADITPPAEAIALKGAVSLMLSDITTPTEAVDLKGRIGTIEELSESVKLPPVPGLKGGIIDIVLQQNASKPIVPGLVGEIAQLLLAENLDIPDLPALRIPVIYDIPDLPEGNVDVGPLQVVDTPDDTPAPTPAAADNIPGIINAELNLAFDTPVELTGIVNAELNKLFDEPVEVQGQIANLRLDASLPDLDLVGEIAQLLLAENLDIPDLPALRIPVIYDVPDLPEGNVDVGPLQVVDTPDDTPTPTPEMIPGIINAELNKLFDEPVQIAGIINATVNAPALRDGMVEIGPLEVVGAPGETPTPTPTPELIPGLINAELNKLFDEPVQIAGIINATVNAPALRDGMVEIGPLEVVGPRSLRDAADEDPENPQLDIGDLEGEIDSLKISDDAIAALEPVLLQGEIQATLVKLFTEPILLDGIINARVNYLTGANEAPGGGGDGGGDGGDATRDLTNSITTLGQKLDSVTASPAPDASVPSLQQEGGAVADRGQPTRGGGGNAIQVTFPPSLRSAITSQANTLLELQSAQKEFFQSSVAFYNKAGNQNLTANQHLSGIRRVLASETEDNETLNRLATEATLTSISDTLNQIRVETQRVADAPLVDRLVEAGVVFPNDPQDPTNAAFTQSPIQDILSQGGLSLFAGFDNIDRNLQTLLDSQAYAQGAPDLSQMPGTSEGTPMYAHIVNQPPVQDVRVVNEVDVKGEVNANVKGTVDVKQVGVVQVSQSGEWVMQLASGQTIPVYVQGGSVQASLSQGGISTLAELIDVENQRRGAFNTAI